MKCEKCGELYNKGDWLCHHCKWENAAITANKSMVSGILSILIILPSFVAYWGALLLSLFSIIFGIYAIVTAFRLKKKIGKYGIGFALGIIGITLSVLIPFIVLNLYPTIAFS